MKDKYNQIARLKCFHLTFWTMFDFFFLGIMLSMFLVDWQLKRHDSQYPRQALLFYIVFVFHFCSLYFQSNFGYIEFLKDAIA